MIVLLTIDIGSPEVKACAAVVAKCASLCADDRGYSLDELVIKGGTHQDGLREGRRVAEFPGRREVNADAQCHAVLEVQRPLS